MIKREDVIIDPTDPRVEGLIGKGKKVLCGDEFAYMHTTGILESIHNNPPYFQVDGAYFRFIAPVPEPTYRKFKSAEEFKPYRDKWVKSHRNNGTFKIDWHNDDFIYEHGESVITWETAFEDYYFEDGTPFGVKE